MPFRFVHTADIHLDSPLRSLALRDPALADLIGGATRAAFVATVEVCLSERVDALMIAGDLYDGSQTSMKTAAFLAAELHRLHTAGIQTFIVRGNHDAESKITRELVLPESVRVFTGRAECHVLPGAADGRDVAVHGISFAQPHAPESLLPKFKAAAPDALNIGLLHTSLGGAPGHDTYAPCSVTDLMATGFDYWGLGHIHARTVHRAAGPAIVMPGQPQGRDINEAGAKSVTLVSIDGGGSIALDERITARAQFARVPVAVDGVEDWRALLDRIETALSQARVAAPCEHLVARLHLTGETPLAWRIRVDGDLLQVEARLRADRIGATWIEAIETDVRPPRTTMPATGAANPAQELRALVAEDVVPSASFQTLAREIAEEVRDQLPRDARALFGTDEAAFAAVLADLIDGGAEEVLAHLHGSESQPERDA
ncbi:DNA repair exonuclease [Roseospira marina]|uniref:DNA repair exonuclease n=1 Tax=Roseospira marina TaxID=140057 RepID=A0A5M6IEH9_9PROT|nr:DNA repair exonuclease [Roseospira marina]KAA5606690.1 DNA repair exonuclease [Roseospira marina]MBB4313897.1 DNA repair exonuclease SbcCD nuclease subunit [Roseospira marina]MBB5087059.1 DNA repair exonuclease SbcCD nuclease subunit [Roseospira marina]